VEADSAGSGQQDGAGYQDVAEVLRSGGQADPPRR
jgi:hypothetical protein